MLLHRALDHILLTLLLDEQRIGDFRLDVLRHHLTVGLFCVGWVFFSLIGSLKDMYRQCSQRKDCGIDEFTFNHVRICAQYIVEHGMTDCREEGVDDPLATLGRISS